MNEHEWPGDDSSFDDADADAAALTPPDDDPLPLPDLDDTWDEPEPQGWEPPETPVAADPGPEPDLPATPAAHSADDVAGEPGDVFPPPVDLGALPEPVDGWPWIDTGSLGLAGAGVADPAALGAPEPAELAEYAAEELPPAVDPWAHLAGSDDPATAALARFYRPGDTGGDA